MNLAKLQRIHDYIARRSRALDDIRGDILQINGKVSRLESAKTQTGINAGDVKKLDAEIAELKKKQGELRPRDQELSAALSADIALRNACREFLSARGVADPGEDKIKRDHSKPPPLPIDEASAATLSGIRQQIEELRADARKVERAWPPAKLLTEAKHQQIDDLIDTLCRPKADLSNRFSTESLLTLLVAANAAQIKKVIASRIQEICPDDALSPEEKSERLKEIAGKITDLERQEEALCVQLEADNISVVRRADLSPEVFLEVNT